MGALGLLCIPPPFTPRHSLVGITRNKYILHEGMRGSALTEVASDERENRIRELLAQEQRTREKNVVHVLRMGAFVGASLVCKNKLE